MSMFSHLYGQSEAPAPGGSAVNRSDPSASPLADVNHRLETLTLLCMAMWSLIQEETKLTEQDLVERVKQCDLLDDVADGKITRKLAKCSACGRPMSPRHKRCIYCGADRLILSPFDTLSS